MRPTGAGSSPLARGLQVDAVGDHVALGIIPARAGFTASMRRMDLPNWDHPRSRGVYGGIVGGIGGHDGSSPLARGLLDRVPSPADAVRIIPARAGFTGRVRQGDRGGSGSSPLARGLRRRRQLGHAVTGIIPARAGFTCARNGISCAMTDHPRSRGVYIAVWIAVHTAVGSSPLARGLPTACRRKGTRSRIIPARAGFTL